MTHKLNTRRGPRSGKPTNASGPKHIDPGAATSRPASPTLQGDDPVPEELTGRASRTDEDLTALFGNSSAQHLADGFRGGSEDELPVDELVDGQ